MLRIRNPTVKAPKQDTNRILLPLVMITSPGLQMNPRMTPDPKKKAMKIKDEERSMSSNQHGHLSSEEDDSDTPYYDQQTSQDHGLGRRE